MFDLQDKTDRQSAASLAAAALDDALARLPTTDLSLGEATPAAVDFRQVIEQAAIGICITQDGFLRYVNPQFAQMHGRTREELVGTDYAFVVDPSDRARVAEIRRLRDAGLHRSAYESRNLRRDGSVFETRVFGRAIVYRGRPASLVTLSDISDLVEAHRVSAWRARMLVSHESLCRSGSIDVEVARRRVRLSTGARALALLGDEAGELTLPAMLRYLPADDRKLVSAEWRRARPGEPFEFRHALRRRDGSVITVLHRGVIEIEHDGQHRPVAILQDISDQIEAQAQIERLENYHPVTGLATRRLLMKRAEAAVAWSLREASPLALLYLRVPDLERVHDALGLNAGDALASTMAARIVDSCRAEDTVADFGNGEFAVLLDPQAGADEALALQTATRILAALSPPATVDDTELFAGGHIGIAVVPGDASTAAELLANAFAACGRGDTIIGFFTREASVHAVRRIRLEAALRRAFARNELALHYQPQVDLRDGAIVGVEALLRWQSEEFGAVSPAEFVPIAEEIGLIVPMGEWVFRTACEQSVAWAREGLPPVRISVNLSPRQLEQPDISQRLQSVLLSTGADPRHLGVEVTEWVLMRNLEHTRRTLHELSAVGVEISLDDFGTGYANLAMLRALPFDVLKIDRSLVRDVTAAPEDVAVTRAVMMLAQGLKVKVLAEGVETESQLSLLVSSGCELLQGYLFSRAVPADELAQLLREDRRLPERCLRREAKQRTLLLVDDEENMLSSLRRLLRGAGYQIVIARNGPEGLAKLAEHDVDVIISDQRMPGMTGVEFLRRAKELYPETVRIVLSGYTEVQSITDAINEGAIYKFLTKPWDDERLRAHIAEAFRRKEMSDDNLRLSAELRTANLELAQANARQQQLLTRQREQLSLEGCRAVNAQDLIEHLPTAIIGLDDHGDIVFVNRHARRLAGEEQGEHGWLVGRPADEALPAPWRAVWQQPDGRHHEVELRGERYLLSCTAMADQGVSRGRLLSLVPRSAG